MRFGFTVYGTPEPQGSMKIFVPKGLKHPIITSDSKKLMPYRQQVTRTCLAAMEDSGCRLIERPSPVMLSIQFFFRKPKLASRKTVHKTTKPDIDKLERAVLDALTGAAFEDDSQVVRVIKSKEFGIPERTTIWITDQISGIIQS